VVRPICWFHISDIHMLVSAAWSQDVVLKAMCEDIARQRKGGASADFILATGDLAFSGKADEYKLAAAFSMLSALPRACRKSGYSASLETLSTSSAM
jgi:3',5'-cyclic AMP phosphodiesterase CpdA